MNAIILKLITHLITGVNIATDFVGLPNLNKSKRFIVTTVA